MFLISDIFMVHFINYYIVKGNYYLFIVYSGLLYKNKFKTKQFFFSFTLYPAGQAEEPPNAEALRVEWRNSMACFVLIPEQRNE